MSYAAGTGAKSIKKEMALQKEMHPSWLRTKRA